MFLLLVFVGELAYLCRLMRGDVSRPRESFMKYILIVFQSFVNPSETEIENGFYNW